MIRLLAMLATAGLVVWAARTVDLERWREPASEAGAHLEQAARALAPAAQAELREALTGPEPRVEVRAPAEFAPEQPRVETVEPMNSKGVDLPDPETVETAALELLLRAEPLSSEEVEQIRFRLDRVMELAAGAGG